MVDFHISKLVGIPHPILRDLIDCLGFVLRFPFRVAIDRPARHFKLFWLWHEPPVWRQPNRHRQGPLEVFHSRSSFIGGTDRLSAQHADGRRWCVTSNSSLESTLSNDEHNNAWRQGRFQYNRSVTVAIWIKLDHRASDESWWKTACWLVGGKSKTQSCDETNSATNWSGHANRFDWRNRMNVEFVQRKVL